MAAARAVAALAVLAALPAAAAVAVQYNYTAGGQSWNQTSDWATCGSGVQQSPIVITDSAATYNPAMLPLQLSYGESTAWTLEVTVNYMEVAEIDTVTTGASTFTANAFTDGMTLDGTFIPLNQFHFHSPSEHSINGVHYPLEMHMVHKLYQASPTDPTRVPANTGGTSVLAKAAVIGIMFAYDPADADGAFLAKMIPVFKKITLSGPDTSDDTSVKFPTDTTDTTYGGDVFFNLTSDVFGIIGTSSYYRYNGSLTTPPCTEGISWVNMANPLTLSSRQLLAFTQLLATQQGGASRGGDNRLIQPVNGRTIYSTVPPPAPTLISGAFTFNTNLPASQMSQVETELSAGLAAQLGVDSSDVIIGGFSDVPGASGSGLDVQVTYSIAAASAASASTISQAIAAGSLIPSGGTTSSLAAGLAAAYPDLGISSMSAALPSSVASSDPALAFASVTTANAALTANVLSLVAAAAVTQSNITATMATLTALVASRMPAPPTAIYVTVTHTLGGYTTATFGSAQAAQFIAVLAASVSVSASAVTITNVADVPAAGHRRHRRKALAVASPSGRALMQSGGGVAVSSSIQVASTGLATVVSAALVASPLTTASLQAAGLASCTGVAVSTPPATVSGGAAPTDATGALPQTAPEPVSSEAGARLLLLLILLLLLLPIGAAVAFVVYSRKKKAARPSQEQEQEQEKGFYEAESPEGGSPRPASPPPSASAGPGSRRLGKKRPGANKMGFLDDEPTTIMPATA